MNELPPGYEVGCPHCKHPRVGTDQDGNGVMFAREGSGAIIVIPVNYCPRCGKDPSGRGNEIRDLTIEEFHAIAPLLKTILFYVQDGDRDTQTLTRLALNAMGLKNLSQLAMSLPVRETADCPHCGSSERFITDSVTGIRGEGELITAFIFTCMDCGHSSVRF